MTFTRTSKCPLSIHCINCNLIQVKPRYWLASCVRLRKRRVFALEKYIKQMLYCQSHLIWLFVKPNERLINTYTILYYYQCNKSTINKSLILFFFCTAKHFPLSNRKKKKHRCREAKWEKRIKIKTVIRQKMP